MTHPSDDVLAGLVVGDDVAAAVADHASSCPRCQSVLAELADIGMLLGEHSSADLPEPAPAVWAAVAAATGAPGAQGAQGGHEPGGPVAPPVSLVARRRGRPRAGMPRWLPAAAAAALVVAGFGLGRLTSPGSATGPGVVAQPTGTPSPSVLALAQLTSLDGARVLGRADLQPQGGQLALHLQTGPMTPPAGGYLEVWLINTDGTRMVSVGILDPTGDPVFVVPRSLLDQGYRIVDVSNESFDDKPAHSGDTVMRGLLRA